MYNICHIEIKQDELQVGTNIIAIRARYAR